MEGKGAFVGRSPFPVLFSGTLQVAESNYDATATAAASAATFA